MTILDVNTTGDTLRFPVTASTPASKTKFTLSGAQVNTGTLFGPAGVIVYQCEADGDPADITDPGFHLVADPTSSCAGPESALCTANDPGHNPGVVTYTTTRRVLLVVVTSERFAGTNRNDTARVIGDRTFGCESSVGNSDPTKGAVQSFLIVARNDDFADALAASYVAGQLYAPILLVNTHGPIPQETLDSITFHGITDVFIMGGNVAVGDDVAAQLDGLTSFDCNGAARRTPEDAVRTINVSRIQGADRFGTARAAGLFVFGGPGTNTIGTLNATDDPALPKLRTAILANGRNFPDAMVAGPMAFSGNTCRMNGFTSGTDCTGYPILESDGTSTALPPSTNAFFTERNIEQVIIVGGTAAVPQAIEDAIVARGIKVIRLGGDNRQLTAILVAKFEYQRLQFGVICCSQDPNRVVSLARGDFFPDALTLGPRAGAVGEPILLTKDPTTIGPDTAAFLNVIAGDYFDCCGAGTNGGQNIAENLTKPPATFGFSVFKIEIAGGLVAISQAAEDEALNALLA